jgi:hypothetical protein
VTQALHQTVSVHMAVFGQSIELQGVPKEKYAPRTKCHLSSELSISFVYRRVLTFEGRCPCRSVEKMLQGCAPNNTTAVLAYMHLKLE